MADMAQDIPDDAQEPTQAHGQGETLQHGLHESEQPSMQDELELTIATGAAAPLLIGEDEVDAQQAADKVSTQGLKFIISGALSAIPDLGLTMLSQFAFGTSTNVARTIGFIAGTITAYMINRRWTFKAEPSMRRFLAVALLYTLTYFVNVRGYTLGYHALDGMMPDVIASGVAFILAQGTATVINFVVQRLFIFRR